MSEHPESQNTGGSPEPIGIGFDEIHRFHTEKYIDMLNNMVIDNAPVMELNCALRVNDTKTADTLLGLVPKEVRHSIQEVSETIVNKSRMRIAFLASYSEDPQKASLFFDLCNQAIALGHDALLFSHAQLPKGTSCKAVFFLAHPKSSLSGLVPKVDAVIAENWALASEAFRINAPLKYFLADYPLMNFPFLDERTASAIFKAYRLPIKVLTFSPALAKAASDLFKRNTAVLPVSVNSLAFIDKKAEGKPLRLLIAANGNRASSYTDALGALCYLKANGIEYRIRSVFCLDDGEPCDYDLVIDKTLRPTQPEMLALFRDTDVYLDLSRDDWLSYEIINAMASGCVTILPKDSGALLGLISGQNCVLFDPIKPPGVADALQRVAQNPDLRFMIAKNGRRLAKKHSDKALLKALDQELGASVMQAVRE